MIRPIPRLPPIHPRRLAVKKQHPRHQRRLQQDQLRDAARAAALEEAVERRDGGFVGVQDLRQRELVAAAAVVWVLDRQVREDFVGRVEALVPGLVG